MELHVKTVVTITLTGNEMRVVGLALAGHIMRGADRKIAFELNASIQKARLAAATEQLNSAKRAEQLARDIVEKEARNATGDVADAEWEDPHATEEESA